MRCFLDRHGLTNVPPAMHTVFPRSEAAGTINLMWQSTVATIEGGYNSRAVTTLPIYYGHVRAQ